MRQAIVAALIVSTLAVSGCLRKEAVHTWYLSPDGSVRWVASESNVYSDEEDPGRRFDEEQAYIGPALIGGHTVALGLNSLRPTTVVETAVIRDERPFHVITQARFARIDALVDGLLRELGVRGRTELVSEAGTSTLLVTFDFSREPEEKAGAVLRMVEESTDLRIVLTSGRFVDSPGFDLADRVQARIADAWTDQAQKALDERRSIQMRLTWHHHGDGVIVE